MANLMRVKIQTHGPKAWQITVTNAETGEVLPVLWDDDHGIEIRQEVGVIVARVDLMVEEMDVEALTPVAVPTDRCTRERCVCAAQGKTELCTLEMSG